MQVLPAPRPVLPVVLLPVCPLFASRFSRTWFPHRVFRKSLLWDFQGGVRPALDRTIPRIRTIINMELIAPVRPFLFTFYSPAVLSLSILQTICIYLKSVLTVMFIYCIFIIHKHAHLNILSSPFRRRSTQFFYFPVLMPVLLSFLQQRQ